MFYQQTTAKNVFLNNHTTTCHIYTHDYNITMCIIRRYTYVDNNMLYLRTYYNIFFFFRERMKKPVNPSEFGHCKDISFSNVAQTTHIITQVACIERVRLNLSLSGSQVQIDPISCRLNITDSMKPDDELLYFFFRIVDTRPAIDLFPFGILIYLIFSSGAYKFLFRRVNRSPYIP